MCFGYIFWWQYLFVKRGTDRALLNLLFETLSKNIYISFDQTFDLTADMNFQIKHSMLSNVKRKSKQDKKTVAPRSKILMNSLKNLGMIKSLKKKKKKQDLSRVFQHTKTENPYISPTAQNAETIEKETKMIL